MARLSVQQAPQTDQFLSQQRRPRRIIESDDEDSEDDSCSSSDSSSGDNLDLEKPGSSVIVQNKSQSTAKSPGSVPLKRISHEPVLSSDVKTKDALPADGSNENDPGNRLSSGDKNSHLKSSLSSRPGARGSLSADVNTPQLSEALGSQQKKKISFSLHPSFIDEQSSKAKSNPSLHNTSTQNSKFQTDANSLAITDILQGLSISDKNKSHQKVPANSQKSTSFFDRLELHKKETTETRKMVPPSSQKQQNQLETSQPHLKPQHRSAPTSSPLTKQSDLPRTTFGSPVKSYSNSTSSLLEPWTPKSSQWGKPVNISALKNSVPLNESNASPSRSSSHSTNEIKPSDLNILKGADSWGLNARALHFKETRRSSFGPSTNSYYEGDNEYIDPSKVKEQITSLLETFDTLEDDDNMTEGQQSVEGLSVKLLPHQVKGLKFLKSREGPDIENKCGLLCDDMGLGKTVQSISLILSMAKPPISANRHNSKNSGLNSIKTTLVICPLSLLTQWRDEILSKAPSLTVLVHHGPKREKNKGAIFESYDVVVTTYEVVTRESQSANLGPIYTVNWWRVILDEAHTIKNRQTKTAQGCYQIKSNSRWCLTGTPIQNSIDELQSLFIFLNVKPYNNYLTWKRDIIAEITRGRGVAALRRLHVILHGLMLRRTKSVLEGAGFELPERNVRTIMLDLACDEREFYTSMSNKAKKALKGYMDEGSNGSYMGVLVLLLRLRQACCHRNLICKKINADDEESCISAGAGQKNNDKNNSSMNNENDALSSLMNNLSLTSKVDPLFEKENTENYSAKDDSKKKEKVLPSSKMVEMLKILKEDSHRKTIIFSQFTSMLDILEPFLKENGFKYVRYDGSMTRPRREESLAELKTNPSVQILLCSLKCGALGLNLTCANRVVLFDPWWNPMINEQAIDRVHRIGQTVNVDVYQFIVKDSVEEKILNLQNSKRELASGVLNGGDVLIGNKLTLEQMIDLF